MNNQLKLKTVQSANIYQLGMRYTKARLCINAVRISGSNSRYE